MLQMQMLSEIECVIIASILASNCIYATFDVHRPALRIERDNPLFIWMKNLLNLLILKRVI